MQETWLQSLVWEDLTYCGAPQPCSATIDLSLLYSLGTTTAEADEPQSLCPATRKPTAMKSMCLPQLEKSPNSREDPVGGCVTNFSRRKETQITSKTLLPFVISKVLIYYLVAKSRPTLPLHGLQCARLPCASLSPRVKLVSIQLVLPSNISTSVACFSCPQSFPASGSFPVSRLFASGGQRIGASASVLPVNIQC